MTDSDSAESEIAAFDLAEFIGEHSQLFAIMGVFGALAIYISRSTAGDTPMGEDMIKVGYVSAFGLSLLMYGLIYKQLADEFGGWNTLLQGHFYLRNAALTAFSLFSALLVLSISYVLTRHEPVIFLLLLMVAVVVGMGAVLRILLAVDRLAPNTITWRVSALLVSSTILLFLGTYIRARLASQYETKPIQELSLLDPAPVAISMATTLVDTIAVVAMFGFMLAVLGLPFTLVDDIRKAVDGRRR